MPDVPVEAGGLIVKIGFTINCLLHNVDFVLGAIWLQLLNPIMDWNGGKLHISNAIHIALLHGSLLEGHVQAGDVTVISSEEGAQQLQDERIQFSISVLKTPNFGKKNGQLNSRTNFSKTGK